MVCIWIVDPEPDAPIMLCVCRTQRTSYFLLKESKAPCYASHQDSSLNVYYVLFSGVGAMLYHKTLTRRVYIHSI
jgi:hypothetical protein